MKRPPLALLMMLAAHGANAEEEGKTPIIFFRSPLEVVVTVPPPAPQPKPEAEAANATQPDAAPSAGQQAPAAGEEPGERRLPPGNQTVTHTLAVEVRSVPADQKELTADLKVHTERSGIVWVYEADRPKQLDTSLLIEEADVAAINRSGQITQTLSAVPPGAEDVPAYSKPPYAVLFLKRGTLARLGMKPGDRVKHRVFQGGTLVENMVEGSSNVKTGPVIFQSR